MTTVNVSASIGTNIGLTNNLGTKGKKVKVDFAKLLSEKSTNATATDTDTTVTDATTTDKAIQDSVNQLMVLLTNLQSNISSEAQSDEAKVNVDNQKVNVDNKGELILKDSTDDKIKDLISSLSLLLNQLNTKPQSNDLTSMVDLTSKTTSSGETSKVDGISNLISEIKSKFVVQGQQFNDEKQSYSKSKVQILNELLNPKNNNQVTTNSIISSDSNEKTDNVMSSTKITKEIKNVIEQILSTVKSAGTGITLKTDDITKLQVVLKNLTQVIADDEKQVSSKKTSEDLQTFIKPQLLSNAPSSSDNGKQDSNTQNSKANVNVDKVLQKIAGDDSSDKAQSFVNLVARASNQGDVATTKAADNLVINKDTITNDVIKTVKYMNVNDVKELTVKITPNGLGEVTIKLTQDGGAMKASITTSNKEAFQLINSNLQDINSKITSNNMSIQSFSVDVYNGESSMFKQGAQQNKESKQGKSKNASDFEAQDDIDVESIGYKDSNVNILV